MKTQSLKNRPIGRIAAVAAILAATAAVLLLLHGWETRRQANDAVDDPYAGQEESLTYYNGAWYARKELETVLVMGVDKYADDAAAVIPIRSRRTSCCCWCWIGTPASARRCL